MKEPAAILPRRRRGRRRWLWLLAPALLAAAFWWTSQSTAEPTAAPPEVRRPRPLPSGRRRLAASFRRRRPQAARLPLLRPRPRVSAGRRSFPDASPQGNPPPVIRRYPKAPHHALPAPGRVDRASWYREQTLYLQRAVDNVFTLLRYTLAQDPEYWDQAWGQRLHYAAAGLSQHYAQGEIALWQLAPDRWRCDAALDAALQEQVSVGCPAAAELRQLAIVWRQLGLLNRELELLGPRRGALWKTTRGTRGLRAEALLSAVARLEVAHGSLEAERQALTALGQRYELRISDGGAAAGPAGPAGPARLAPPGRRDR